MKRIKRVPYYLIKNTKSYTRKELAELLKVCPCTVLQWIKKGLPVMKDRKPWLFVGYKIKKFFKEQRRANKISLKEGEFYCPKCLKAVRGKDLKQIYGKTLKGGNFQIILKAVCENCGTKISRFSSKRKVEELKNK